jgi:hypothetical protein
VAFTDGDGNTDAVLDDVPVMLRVAETEGVVDRDAVSDALAVCVGVCVEDAVDVPDPDGSMVGEMDCSGQARVRAGFG